MTDRDGQAWLLTLAERYEASARRLRELAALAAACPCEARQMPAPLSGSTELLGDEEPVWISEAIRRALSRARRPLTSAEIRAAVAKMNVRTRSGNSVNLVDSTLSSMRRAQHVRAAGHRRWELVP